MEIIGKNEQQSRIKEMRKEQKAKDLAAGEGKETGTAEEMLMSAHVSALSVFSETKQLPDTPSSSFRSRRSPPKCQQFFPRAVLPVAAGSDGNC